ncbi:MAG TPA: hypothetical protein VIE65_22955, partial [Methylobacter sp.]
IETPYGPLTTVMIPIPGDVIQAMADSLSQVQQQLSPMLSLISPSPASFTVTITEGDPDTKIGTITVQNAGAFGSIMSAYATPGVSWLKTQPSVANGLGKNDQANFDIIISSSILLNSASPYSGIVVVQDNKNPPTIIPITVNVIVLPRPVVVVSPTTVTLSYTLCTSTVGPSQLVNVINGGPAGSTMNFVATKINGSAWLSVFPASGSNIASGGTFPITLSVVRAGVPLLPGTYTDIVRVASPNASNGYIDIPVQLVVSP